MTPTRAAVVMVVAVLALGVAASRAHAQLLSPGPLSSAHAAIDGDDHCSSCHQSGRKVVATRCLSCHEDLGKRISAGTGLHGRNYANRPCEDCHVEHIGRSAKLVRWPGGAMDRLDHKLTGWPLEGDHAGAACLDCHTQKKQGKPTFLGATAVCGSCHDDPHGGRFPADCAGCHDTRDWQKFDAGGFNHSMSRYPLTGAHMGVACDGCHGTPPRWKGIAFATCDSCHDDPHDGKFLPRPCTACHGTASWVTADARMRGDHPWLSLANGHRTVACKSCHDRGSARPPSKGNRCVSCHPAVHEAKFGSRCETCHGAIRWLGLPDAVGRKAHGQTDYPLEGRHTTVSCAACHPTSQPPARRYRALSYDRCAACHQDRHTGEFAGGSGAGECAACHTVTGFAPTTFDADDHATTRFALDGKHVVTPCRDCHGDTRPRLDLRQPKQRCAECHDDPHRGQFAAEIAAGGCGQCHSTASWHQPRVDHSTWPLTGAHQRTSCAACHGEATDPARPGTYRGIPRDCEGCHDDRHAGQFRLGPPVRPCTDCHVTEAFKLPAFDHAAVAAYPLEGKHATTACDRCHPNSDLRNGASAVRYRLGYRACVDCHANPHDERPVSGQSGMLDDCAACHAPAGWKLTASAGGGGFDHDRTGFPLRGAHNQQACAGCHSGTMQPPVACEGCHRDPHAGRLDGACEDCHATTTWRDTGALDRHRRTRMPLTGRHAQLDCVACHVRQDPRTWSSTPVTCWSCHAGDYRAPTTHPDHDGDPADPTREVFPRDCGRCHRTSGWSPAMFDPTILRRSLAGDAGDVRHDAWFVLTTGSHRDAACGSCHVDRRRATRVRCDGCHGDAALRIQHPGAVPVRATGSCLGCHPRGRRR